MDWLTIMNNLTMIDWNTLSNIAVVLSAIFVIWQLSEMRRTTQAQAYSVAREILQDERARKARRTVFQLGREARPLEKWTKEEIEDAEIVCHTYDTVGQMVRYRLLWKIMIIDSWGHSIRASWPVVSPLVNKYRRDWDQIETWDDYEWLFYEANKFDYLRRKRQTWLQKLRFGSRVKNT